MFVAASAAPFARLLRGLTLLRLSSQCINQFCISTLGSTVQQTIHEFVSVIHRIFLQHIVDKVRIYASSSLSIFHITHLLSSILANVKWTKMRTLDYNCLTKVTRLHANRAVSTGICAWYRQTLNQCIREALVVQLTFPLFVRTKNCNV